MANAFDELFQSTVDMSYEEKVQMATIALGKCFAILKKQELDDEYALQFIVSFLATAVAADGVFTEPEKRMIRDVFSEDQVDMIDTLVKFTDEEGFEGMDQFVDSLDAEEKKDFCLLAIFIAAVDDTIKKDELGYIVKLMQ